MTFLFDLSIGIAIPRALQLLRLTVDITYHDEQFAPDEADDVWLPKAGASGWFVIGHDYYHVKPNELAAIQQYAIGCFYLWGAEATKWETMRVFARAYDRIVRAAEETARPFAYNVHRNGTLAEVFLS